MRSSSVLPLIALVTRLVYGFSSQTGALFCRGAGIGSLGTTHHHGSRQTLLSSPVNSRTKNGIFLPRGGAIGKTGSSLQKSSDFRTPYKTGSKSPLTGAATFLSIWGTGGVLYILAKAIKRVLPIALEPFQQGNVPLSQVELGIYIVTCTFFAYYQGYKGFQLKFSPLVVARSFTLYPGKNGTAWYHYLLAPFYSKGLIHATHKRKIVSWSVTIGVAGIAAAVKRLPYPWRNIVDAGVVVGLCWGSLSILLFYIKSWMTGQPPKVDTALPDTSSK